MLRKLSAALLRLRAGPRLDPAAVVKALGTEFEVDKWALSDFVVERLVPIVGVRPYPLDELLLMTAAVCRVRPSHILEWGTHLGKSARIFHETCAAFGIPAEIHSTDLPDRQSHGEHPGSRRGELVREIGSVRLHQGDGLEVSLEVCRGAGPDCRPLFFLDGDHQYDSVRRELEGIMAERPRAGVLVHDTFFQSAESGYNLGPHRAIADVLPRWPPPPRSIATQTGLPGMTLLYQPGPAAPAGAPG